MANALKEQIERIRTLRGALLAQGRFEVFAFQAPDSPELMLALGELRELSFRAAGEGTGQDRDIDAFDSYYTQLLLWNRSSEEIVGAYRLVDAGAVLRERGLDGLYVQSLFKLGPPVVAELDDALELGRSFVRPEYQKDFLPLFMLWRGLGAYIAAQPRFTRLFGCVSISPAFKAMTTRLLLAFLKQNSFDGNRAAAVEATNAAEVADALAPESMLALQSLVNEIEEGRLKVPPLLRHYLKLGGRILAFNVDHAFNDTIDALITVELPKSPPKLLEKYMGPEAAASYLQYHRERTRS